MGSFSIWHWLIVLVIIALVFGTKKLRNVGSDLGSAVKGFKEGMKDASADKPADQVTQQRVSDDTIDVQAKEKATPSPGPGPAHDGAGPFLSFQFLQAAAACLMSASQS